MYFFTVILFIYIFAKVFSKKFRRLNIDKKITNYYE